MNENTLLTLLTVFIILAAVAMVAQAIALVGLFLVTRDIKAKLFQIWPSLENLVGTSKRSIETAERHIEAIGASSAAILDTTKSQLVKVDELLTDATARARVQLDRAELVLDDTMTRVQQTVGIVQKTVLFPVREVNGIWTGIRTAVAHFNRANRPTVDHATSDEEMFI